MPRTELSTEAKASMQANLELEITARKDKLLAMCEAQCASLRSRLERRVNRVPSNKRTTTLIEVMEPAPAPPKVTATKKAKEPAAPVPAPKTGRSRAATKTGPAPAVATKPAAKAAPKAAAKATRGVKRTSDEISADDKENNAELQVPKKRAKAAPAAPAARAGRATRATRAASKKVDPATQILSPKNSNVRPAPPPRVRRQR